LGNVVGQPHHLLFRLGFDHYAGQSFGAGVTHHDASLPVQFIFRDGEASTGAGLLTALRVMAITVRTGRSLRELVSDLKVFPQTIQNVRVREKTPFQQVPEIARAIASAENELDGKGRVVVRYSGTEALARVMIEAESEEKMMRLADNIAQAIRSALGANS